MHKTNFIKDTLIDANMISGPDSEHSDTSIPLGIKKYINKKIPQKLFDSVISKLCIEPELEEMYLMFLTRKLNEIYQPEVSVNIGMVDIAEMTCSPFFFYHSYKSIFAQQNVEPGTPDSFDESTALDKDKSSHLSKNVQKRIAFYYPSLLSEDDFAKFIEVISKAEIENVRIDILSLFGHYEDVKQLANESFENTVKIY